MKGKIDQEQRGTFICTHTHEFKYNEHALRVQRVLRVQPGPGSTVQARDGKLEYIVGPRGNLIKVRSN